MTWESETRETLDGLATYAMWYGFDKALETEGKHTSSTVKEAMDGAIDRLREINLKYLPPKPASLSAQESKDDTYGIAQYNQGYNAALDAVAAVYKESEDE